MSKFYSEMSSVPPPRIFWLLLSLCIAVGAEIAAALIIMLIQSSFLFWNSASAIFLVAAPLAALLVGLPGWWLFVVRPRHATMRRGISIGAWGSIIVHPLVWMFIVPVWMLVPPGPLLFSISMTLLRAVFTYGAATFLSLILVGWFTASIGGVVGFLLIYLQRAVTHHWRQRGGFPKDDISRLYDYRKELI